MRAGVTGRAEQAAALISAVTVETLLIFGPEVSGRVGLRGLVIDMTVKAVGLIDPRIAWGDFV